MAESIPTFVDDLCYSGNDLRLMQAGLVCGEGVAGSTHFVVGETSPTSGNVLVGPGHAFVENDNGTGTSEQFNTGGMYHVYNDDDVELEVPLNSTGSDRTDIVWIRVCDSEYAAVTSGFELVYEINNPGALDPPADGCTYMAIARVIVPNGSGTGGSNITDAMVEDNRVVFDLCGDHEAGWVRETATLDFPSIGAGLAESLTMTVNGASVGDPVAVGNIIGAFSSSLIWSAYVSAANTVTCRVFNPTGGALNPPSSAWTVAVKTQ